jgi:hypothetical protein
VSAAITHNVLYNKQKIERAEYENNTEEEKGKI